MTLAFGEIVPRVLRELDERSRHRLDGLLQRPAGHHAGRQDRALLGERRCSTPLELEPVYYVALAMVLLVLFVNFRLRDSRLGRRGSPCARTRSRRRRWASTSSARSSGPTRSARRSAASPAPSSATYKQHGQRRPVRVRLLGLHPLHGHPRRDGQHLGVILGADRAVDDRPLPAAPAGQDARVAGLDFDVTSINFGIFGFFLLVMMVLRPEGFLPSGRRARAARREATRSPPTRPIATPGEDIYEVRHECLGAERQEPREGGRSCWPRARNSKSLRRPGRGQRRDLRRAQARRSSRSSAPTARARRRSSTA